MKRKYWKSKKTAVAENTKKATKSVVEITEWVYTKTIIVWNRAEAAEYLPSPKRICGSVGWTMGCCAGGREFDSGRTNTQGLKNNWVESAAFVNYIGKWLDFQVFSDKDYKP